jgi:hypothetical protein
MRGISQAVSIRRSTELNQEHRTEAKLKEESLQSIQSKQLLNTISSTSLTAEGSIKYHINIDTAIQVLHVMPSTTIRRRRFSAFYQNYTSTTVDSISTTTNTQQQVKDKEKEKEYLSAKSLKRIDVLGGSAESGESVGDSSDLFWKGIQTAITTHAILGIGGNQSHQHSEKDIMATIFQQVKDHYLINPLSHTKSRWDVLVLGIVVFSLLWLPFTFSFTTKYDTSFNSLEITLCVFFLMDMLITFNCAVFYPNRKLYYSTRYDIAIIYIKGYFLVDFASSVPFDMILEYILPDFDGNILKLIRLVRFIRLTKVIKFLKKYELNRYQTAAMVGHLLYYSPIVLSISVLVVGLFYLIITE